MNLVSMCIGCGQIYGCRCGDQMNYCEECDDCNASIATFELSHGLCDCCLETAMEKRHQRHMAYVASLPN